MSDLRSFLKARLDEDERLALAPRPTFVFVPSLRTPSAPTAEEVTAGVDLNEPVRKRALAEVAFKRRILEGHGSTSDGECPGCGATLMGMWITGPGELCPKLLDMAEVYAAHPDFREEWRV